MLTRAEKKISDINHSQTWAPSDAILIACFLFAEEMVLKGEMHHANVELFGLYTRGQVAIERASNDVNKNIHFILQANATAFKEYILEAAEATVSETFEHSLKTFH